MQVLFSHMLRFRSCHSLSLDGGIIISFYAKNNHHLGKFSLYVIAIVPAVVSPALTPI
jgi:hypothetical protein